MSEKIEKRQTLPLVSKTEKISMKLIDPFPNHPFYVFDDNEMLELIECIRKNGLITPIIVRRKGDRYELISGHRRKRAYEYLGYAEIACSVINASDDEAIIMMVDSNGWKHVIGHGVITYRNNTYKEAIENGGKVEEFEHLFVVINSLSMLKAALSDQGI